MKTICLQTEFINKYLSTHLFDDNWDVAINTNGTTIQNIKTNENVFILDIYSGNAVLVDLKTEAPDDWVPRAYYYYPETDLWEFIPPIEEPVIVTVEEPVIVLTE